MRIVVELFGLPRHRAGVSELLVELDKNSPSLADLVASLAESLPGLQPDCIILNSQGVWEFTPHVVGNLNGERFIRQGNEVFREGDRLLVLSADVGG
jgi:molybdopterin converting factor small subunit